MIRRLAGSVALVALIPNAHHVAVALARYLLARPEIDAARASETPRFQHGGPVPSAGVAFLHPRESIRLP